MELDFKAHVFYFLLVDVTGEMLQTGLAHVDYTSLQIQVIKSTPSEEAVIIRKPSTFADDL